MADRDYHDSTQPSTPTQSPTPATSQRGSAQGPSLGPSASPGAGRGGQQKQKWRDLEGILFDAVKEYFRPPQLSGEKEGKRGGG